MVHELKTWPEYFTLIMTDQKPFEVRRDDRDFRINDFLWLREFDPRKRHYTGAEQMVIVTYVMREEEFVKPGFCIMGIQRLAVATDYRPYE